MSLPGVTRYNFTMRSSAKSIGLTWLDFVMPPVLVLMLAIIVIRHLVSTPQGDE